MANKTFDGFAYFGDGTISSGDINYQGFFYPNGTASSPAKWNTVKTVESSGYYNINLGDADWLGVAGVALPGSIVLIVFWKGNTLDRNSLCVGDSRLEEWGVIEIEVTGEDVYTNQVQVKPNISPNVVWDINSIGTTATNIAATNASYDVHYWQFGSTTMHHYRTRYGENIQLINTITTTIYDWGDGTQDVLGGVSDGSHVWGDAGIYNVTIQVIDECSAIGQDTKEITIYYRQPVPNIACNQAVNNHIEIPNTYLTFNYSGTDPDNRITNIEWTINDSGLYGDTTTIVDGQRDAIIEHINGKGTSWCGEAAELGAFTNPGEHVILIKVYWNDGFSEQLLTYSETFIQDVFSKPLLSFSQDPTLAVLNSPVLFTNTSTNTSRVGTGLPNCLKYDWELKSNNQITDEVFNVDFAYVYEVIPTDINSIIGLTAYWNDGWENKEEYFETEIIFATKVLISEEDCYYGLDIIGTSLDGTISAYKWDIYFTTATGINPWELIWESPTALDQKQKTIGFTKEGYYKIVGYIYGGGTTSDEELLYIDKVCEDSCADEIIWDGTGALDTPTLWQRHGYGIEAPYARYTGTNGLDATGLVNNTVLFSKSSGEEVSSFESLVFWINTRYIAKNSDLLLTLTDINNKKYTNYLSNFITIDELNVWKKVIINLDDFNKHLTTIKEIKFSGIGKWDFYLDRLMLSTSRLYFRLRALCEVDMVGDSIGEKFLHSKEITPQIGISSSDITPHINAGDNVKPKIR